jgi:hypothetical protein
VLSWIVGLLLIGGGLFFAVLAVFAAGMADREVNTLHEVVYPIVGCMLPVVAGVAIIVWR